MNDNRLHGFNGMSIQGADEVIRTTRGVTQGEPTPKVVADRFEQEQLFEEDVRTVLSLMRPNRYERLIGWSEYRTGGANFRATISWSPEVEQSGNSPVDDRLAIPHLTDVLESILVGSVKNQDELYAHEEFEIYRDVVRELHRRLDEMQSCYE
jgi:hypothetical protein